MSVPIPRQAPPDFAQLRIELFHCYDVRGLPRTNNDRESVFHDLNRRLLSTTGQKGLVKRIIHRKGAWETIPRPDTLRDTINALSQVGPEEFSHE